MDVASTSGQVALFPTAHVEQWTPSLLLYFPVGEPPTSFSCSGLSVVQGAQVLVLFRLLSIKSTAWCCLPQVVCKCASLALPHTQHCAVAEKHVLLCTELGLSAHCCA